MCKSVVRTILALFSVISIQGCSEVSPQKHIDVVFNSFALNQTPKIVQVLHFEHNSNQSDVDSSGEFEIEKKDHEKLLKKCLLVNAKNGQLTQKPVIGQRCRMVLKSTNGIVDIMIDKEDPILYYKYSA